MTLPTAASTAAPTAAPAAPGLAWIAVVPALALVLAAWVAGAGANVAWFRAGHDAAPALPDAAWQLLTHLGDTQFALALVALALPFAPRWFAATLWAAVPATLFVHVFKGLVPAARPLAVLGLDGVRVIGEPLRAGSFPSGHTTTAFVAAGCVALCLSPAARRALGVPLVALAAGVGFSRVAVGAHWPLDVFAGAAGGWLCAAFGVWASARWTHLQRRGGLLALGALALGLGVALALREFPTTAEEVFARALGLATIVAGAAALHRTWRAPRLGPL